MGNFYRLLCLFIWIIFPAALHAAGGHRNLVGPVSNDTFSSRIAEEHIVFAFDTPFNYPFSLTTGWSIKKENSGNILKRGSGPVRNLIFEKPGTYIIDVAEELNHDPETCNHLEYPEKITVEVSPFHMEFDFSTIQLSQETIGGQLVDGHTLSVDVVFNTYGKEEVECLIQPFTSAGVGTTIIGTPIQERVTLRPGVNTLIYRLSGQAHRDTYIMFDFLDVNNQVQVYNLTEKIK